MFGIFGPITNPLGTTFGKAGGYASVEGGLPLLISNVVRLITVLAGLWMFFNLLTAGFMYLTSNGEAEKVARAWNMIWQSLVGLLVIVASFAITGVISQLLFGDPKAILEPALYGPGKAGL